MDLYKLSHHGSKFTTDRGLLEKLDCPLYVFSTNGSIFHHPDQETVARVIMAGGDHPELVFNYRTKHNDIWDGGELKQRYGYTVRYPSGSEQGIEIDLSAVD